MVTNPSGIASENRSWFESCVVLDGNQPVSPRARRSTSFESCVVLDGNQTDRRGERSDRRIAYLNPLDILAMRGVIVGRHEKTLKFLEALRPDMESLLPVMASTTTAGVAQEIFACPCKNFVETPGSISQRRVKTIFNNSFDRSTTENHR